MREDPRASGDLHCHLHAFAPAPPHFVYSLS